MKHLVIFSFCFLFFVPLNAQKDDETSSGSNSPTAVESHNYIAASGGYYLYPLSDINKQLKLRGATAGFMSPIGIGLDRGYNVTSAKLTHSVTGLLSFHYMMPQTISSANDSLKFRLNGYNAQFDLIGVDIAKSETITWTATLGWCFGRLKVTEDAPAGKSTYINKYFDPELRMEFNVRLAEHFYIGARYAYYLDLSKGGWAKSVENSMELVKTPLSGHMAGVFIGYGK